MEPLTRVVYIHWLSAYVFTLNVVPKTSIEALFIFTINGFVLSLFTTKRASPFRNTSRFPDKNLTGKRNSDSELIHTCVPSDNSMG